MIGQLVAVGVAGGTPQTGGLPSSVIDVVVVIGVGTTIAGLVYIGRKLQVLDDLKITMEKVKSNVSVMANALMRNKSVRLDGSLLESYSPVRVTAEGVEYLRYAGFVRVFEGHKDDFFDSIREENPKTDYDIEGAAVRSVVVLFSKEYFAPVKEYLYNNPRTDRNEFMNVAGIYVREKFQREART